MIFQKALAVLLISAGVLFQPFPVPTDAPQPTILPLEAEQSPLIDLPDISPEVIIDESTRVEIPPELQGWIAILSAVLSLLAGAGIIDRVYKIIERRQVHRAEIEKLRVQAEIKKEETSGIFSVEGIRSQRKIDEKETAVRKQEAENQSKLIDLMAKEFAQRHESDEKAAKDRAEIQRQNTIKLAAIEALTLSIRSYTENSQQGLQNCISKFDAGFERLETLLVKLDERLDKLISAQNKPGDPNG